MTTPTAPVVRVSRRYPFPAQRVYDAWLDPGLARRFLFATADGEMLRVEIDARVGGHFTVVERRPQGDAPHYGVYLVLERPQRIEFAFSVERHDPDADRVRIDIAADGDGCVLTLTHALAPAWADFAERTEAGWTRVLAGLAASLQTATGTDGGPP